MSYNKNMILGIYTNIKRDTDCISCKKFVQYLDKRSIDFLVCDNAKEYFERTFPLDIVAEKCDFMIVFGGDGTMLYAVSQACKFDKAILGVNLGHIGFLTEIGYEHLETAVDKLLSGDYNIENRTMLKVSYDKTQSYALNEILLSDNSHCHISSFEVFVDGDLADKIRADGIIVSTPTGSTAYSLSCNGPILSPTVKAFIINTMCPHSLHSCPIVVSDDSTVSIKTDNNNMVLIADGKILSCFKDSAEIKISKAEYISKFVRFSGENFYKKLIKKLSYWGD